MVKVAVLVSGGGTNLQKLLESEQAGENPCGKISLVVSSAKDAYALQRAAQFGVPTATVEPQKRGFDPGFNARLLDVLRAHNIKVVVLAGFLAYLDDQLIKAYKGRIINVHPSLIPSFCGAGYYGLKVHRAALARGVKVTGATVHLVDEGIDEGTILLQKAVEVQAGDTPEILQERVMREAEWVILPQALANLCAQVENLKGEGRESDAN